jgi:ribosomal peptide maturation radical SAM protein 1
MQRVLLISMPSAGIYRPMLGISLLKAELAQVGIAADIRYLNLSWARYCFDEIAKGVSTYTEIASRASPRMLDLLFQQSQNNSMADEWIFARALYTADCPSDGPYIEDVLRREYDAKEVETILALRELAPRFLDECMREISWTDYTVVGFTSTFTQHMSSLALAKRVKEDCPQVRIVFGGANCEGTMGLALLRHFRFIDFVASGEGDASFPELLQRLERREPFEGIAGLVWRKNGEPTLHAEPASVRTMDALPTPDYTDFFAQYHQQPYSRLCEVRVPLEQSRGCWWGMRSHCTFCGLNGQTMGFRAKSPDRAEREFLEVKERYAASFVDFTDNILHLGYFETLLPRLAELDHGVELFYEIKSNIKKQQVELLRNAGVRRVQPGIESLSSNILRLMGKGCTRLQNIQCLKWCLQYGILSEWNLLYGFPREDPSDYADMLPVLQAITHLRPPRAVTRIRMDRFSPNFNEAASRGFCNVRPQRPYFHLHPLDQDALQDLAYFFECDYADGRDPESYVAPVRAFVDVWKSQERAGTLVYAGLDDGEAIIDDSRFNSVKPHFELSHLQNRLYTFCDQARSTAQIVEALAPSDGATVRSLLDDFVANRLMVQDGDRFLSLAPTPTLGKTAAEFDLTASVIPIVTRYPADLVTSAV